MSREKTRNRALRAVVEEVKRTEPRPVNWERLEANLMREVQRQAPLEKRERWQPFAWLAVPLVSAAFAFGFWARGTTEHEATTSATAVVAVNSELNGDALGTEEVLHSASAPLLVNHAGRAKWTLAPGSSAQVLSSVGVLRIRLLSGALHAEVVPSKEPERFVVEAAETRVAVHGTVFDVALRGDRTHVNVQQGVVAVGPLALPAQPTALLRANDSADFDRSGLPLGVPVAVVQPSTRRAPLRVPQRAPLPSSSPALAAAASASAETAPAELASVEPAPQTVPAELTIGEVESGVSALVDGVSRCLKENTIDSGNVRVMVHTSVTLEIAADGSVSSALFSPPLSPSVQECSTEEAYAVHFPPSLAGASVTRVLELTR